MEVSSGTKTLFSKNEITTILEKARSYGLFELMNENQATLLQRREIAYTTNPDLKNEPWLYEE